jgi:hypothetical protein
LALSFLFFGLAAQAASMTSPAVRFTFLSQDGKPVEGIALTGVLQYDVLKVEDCTGIPCIPALPHYESTEGKVQVLGKTDSSGVLSVAPSKWTASAITAKNLKMHFYSNGLAVGICTGSYDLHPNDFIEVLPQFLNNQPVNLQELCPGVIVSKGGAESVEMVCHSPYTSEQIEAMRNQVLEHCY